MAMKLEQFTFTAIAGVPLPDFVVEHAEKLVHVLAAGPDGTLADAVEQIASEHPELTKIRLSRRDVRLLLALAIAHSGQGAAFMLPRTT